MPQSVQKVKVLFTAPEDVEHAEDAKQVVAEFSQNNGDRLGAVIEYVDWQIGLVPRIGNRKEIVLSDLGDFDILVCVLWNVFESTRDVDLTNEIFMDALERHDKEKGMPRVIFFFCTKPKYLETVEECEQRIKVIEFQAFFDSIAYSVEFETADDFRKTLRKALHDHVEAVLDMKTKASSSGVSVPESKGIDMAQSREEILERALRQMHDYFLQVSEVASHGVDVGSLKDGKFRVLIHWQSDDGSPSVTQRTNLSLTEADGVPIIRVLRDAPQGFENLHISVGALTDSTGAYFLGNRSRKEAEKKPFKDAETLCDSLWNVMIAFPTTASRAQGRYADLYSGVHTGIEE